VGVEVGRRKGQRPFTSGKFKENGGDAKPEMVQMWEFLKDKSE
jgi:hypothetical protein